MKTISFLQKGVFVAKSRGRGRGRGVFTQFSIPAQAIIEIAPVIVMSQEDRKLIDKTLLHNYIFEWNEDRSECCMALGYVPLYNHSYSSNCEYVMDFKRKLITISAVRKIKSGEELFINYNGSWDNNTPVWFEAI